MKWYNRPISSRFSGILFFSIMIPLFIAYYLQEHRKEVLINECERFTIGYGMTVSDRGKSLNYRYVVEGHTYTDSWGQNPRSWKDYWRGDFVAKNFLYERFLIRFNCKQPKVNKIDWGHSIPANVNAAPYEGWEKLPQNFPKTDFSD